MPKKVALTVDLVGNAEELARLCGVLEDCDVRVTFLLTLNPPKPRRPNQEDQLRMIFKGNHEVCNHTFSHPFNLTWLPPEEMEKEILTGHEAVIKLCSQFANNVELKGFRAPAQVFDDRVFPILSKLGYKWDSSQIFFPALLRPFKITRYGNILELPTLFPNDSALIERYHLSPEKIVRLYKEAFAASGRYFVLTFHPYVTARDDQHVRMLENFIRFVKKTKSEILTMSELADSVL